jgi:hypothetical protein
MTDLSKSCTINEVEVVDTKDVAEAANFEEEVAVGVVMDVEVDEAGVTASDEGEAGVEVKAFAAIVAEVEARARPSKR